jgi:hypothetical protein
LQDDEAAELVWGPGTEVYKDILKALFYKLQKKKSLSKLRLFVRKSYPDRVYPGYEWVVKELQKLHPLLDSQGITVEVIPVQRLVK